MLSDVFNFTDAFLIAKRRKYPKISTEYLLGSKLLPKRITLPKTKLSSWLERNICWLQIIKKNKNVIIRKAMWAMFLRNCETFLSNKQHLIYAYSYTSSKSILFCSKGNPFNKLNPTKELNWNFCCCCLYNNFAEKKNN